MPEADPRPPHIPDYDLLRRVGRGSYGDVWLARGITGAFRAIKIVWRDRFPDTDPFEREFRGVKLFAGLSIKEPRLLSVFHVGRNDEAGFFYYVMEPADDVTFGGELDPDSYQPRTLSTPRSPDQRLPALDAVRRGIDLAEALAVLHTSGLVHRDIKPANVIHVAGVPKLADIGLIAPSGAASFVGTNGYVAPEGPGSPAADVFSLGRVVYELATGLNRLDFPRLPPDVDRLGDADALLELMAVLNRACARDADRRHANADALLAEFRVLLAGRSVRRLRTAEKTVRNAFRAVAALTLIATLGFAGAYLENRRAAAANAARLWAVYAGMLARLQHALDGADYAGARALLAREETTTPPAPPGVERELAARPMLRRALPNPPPSLDFPVTEIRFSRDGRSAAALDALGHLRIQPSGQPAFTLPTTVRQIGEFTPDGTSLLGINAQGIPGRFTTTNGEFHPLLPTQGLGLAAATPDASLLCLTNDYAQCRLEIWNTSAPSPPNGPLLAIPNHPALPDVFAIALNPTTRILAFGRFVSGGTRQRLDIWSIDQRTQLGHIDTRSETWALDLSPDGERLAAGFDSGEVLLADTRSCTPVARIQTGAGRPRQLSFSPDGRRFLFLGMGGILAIGSTTNPSHPATLVASADGLRGAHWLPGGTEILTCDRHGTFARWSSEPPPDHQWRTAPDLPALADAILSPGGRHLAITAGPDSIELVETGSARTLRTFEGAFRPGTFLSHPEPALTGLDDTARIHMWQVDTGTKLWTSPPHPTPVSLVASAGDQRHIALAAIDGTVAVWDLAERRIAHQELPPPEVRSMASAVLGGTPNLPALLGGTYRGTLWIWLPGKPGLQFVTLPTPEPVTALALCDRHRWIAIVQAGSGLTILDLDHPDRPSTPRPIPNRQVFAAATTPDGSRLLLGGAGGIVDFYETRAWTDVGTFRLPDTAGPGNRRPKHFRIDPASNLMAILLSNGSTLWWQDLLTLQQP